jgi:hypothetical protein
MFLFFIVLRLALELARSVIQWVPEALSLGLKWHEGDNSPPTSTEVKNAWSSTSISPYVFIMLCLLTRGTTLHNLKCDFKEWQR